VQAESLPGEVGQLPQGVLQRLLPLPCQRLPTGQLRIAVNAILARLTKNLNFFTKNLSDEGGARLYTHNQVLSFSTILASGRMMELIFSSTSPNRAVSRCEGFLSEKNAPMYVVRLLSRGGLPPSTDPHFFVYQMDTGGPHDK
jgi:hypothetical protein